MIWARPIASIGRMMVGDGDGGKSSGVACVLVFSFRRQAMPRMPLVAVPRSMRINRVSSWSSLWCAVAMKDAPQADAISPSAR